MSKNFIGNPALNRAYDIRGVYPTEVNASVHEAIGRAFAAVVKPKIVAVGADVRSTGPELKKAVIEGLRKSGVNVVDVGIISTDMIYFAVGQYGFDGGIIVSASHNPPEYNGAKVIIKDSAPLMPENGFNEMKLLAQENSFTDNARYGSLSTKDIVDEYIEKCLSFVDKNALKPLRIVANLHFGAVNYSFNALKAKVPFIAIAIDDHADGTFPKGAPDPLRPENRLETIARIKKEKPDFGVAWDGDGDRCFFYDENGEFVDGYYIVAILARYFLELYPKSAILYDPRCWWAIADTINNMGGRAIKEKVGHVYFKGSMRQNDAPYGGEMSAHHYFRDFWYCDNGLIPFLIIWQMVSQGHKLSELAKPFRQKYPTSGEINFTVKNVNEALEVIKNQYKHEQIDSFDGISIEHDREWRASVRGSNNEPLLRLNIEANTTNLVKSKVKEFSALIKSL